MKLALQLAYRNLTGAGLRTWLNVGVLAFAFILIVFFNGLIDGWNQQALHDTIAWEYGHGQLIHAKYDPYDAFTIQDGHGKLPVETEGAGTSILIQQAAVYPEGRMLPVLLYGIDATQSTLSIPTTAFTESRAALPAIIGKGMATSLQLKTGDEVLLRWRDKNGTFDARPIQIVKVFSADVPTVDKGKIYIPQKTLWDMTGLQGESTLFVLGKNAQLPTTIDGWVFKSQATLQKGLNDIIRSKRAGSSIMYLMLLGIALLAIFDTQVLSVFRRQKEIGTYVALGMTRRQVVGLFTVEGSMYSLLAVAVGTLIGLPLLWILSKKGMAIPQASQDMGVALAERIYPVYGFWLIVGTILLIVLAATIVSYLPARKIATMNPVEALKGKLQ